MSMTEVGRSERDDLWTYIGQETWLLQIAEARYLIRTTIRNTYGGNQVRLMMIDHEGDICQFIGLKRGKE
jgi:hypothetical protein